MTGASRRASTTIKFAAKCMHDYPNKLLARVLENSAGRPPMKLCKCVSIVILLALQALWIVRFDPISCAHATYRMPWAALTALVPPTQYLFGTDYSAEPIESTVNEIPNLGISRDVLEMLERKNAAVVSAIQGISCYQEC